MVSGVQECLPKQALLTGREVVVEMERGKLKTTRNNCYNRLQLFTTGYNHLQPPLNSYAGRDKR